MFIKQISIFVENHFGSAADILDALAQKNINIYALSIADTAEYGIMRLIVDNTDAAVALLKEHGVMVKSTDVVAIPIGHRPGGLSEILKMLKDNNVSIEYMYAFVGRERDDAIVVAKTDNMDKACEVLKSNGIAPICASALF